MRDKVRAILEEYKELEQKLMDAAILSDPQELKRIGKRIAEIRIILPAAKEHEKCMQTIADAEILRLDPELCTLAMEEADAAGKRMKELEEELIVFLLPKNPDDDRHVIVEVRAGTGGEEAALFAAELLRMYIRYAEQKGWRTELYSKSDADAGGIKEAIIRIPTNGAYGMLKFESGVHRVQRVPETESKGRLHTSAATVAILPEAEEVDVVIRPEDLKVDVFRSSGPGGQSVNTTDSAVRVTHIPTGVVVSCQDEKSQLKNKNKAMSILRSRLYAAKQERLAKERGELRLGQIGTGDRSEKIRTYNFPQDRVTDHRIKQNFSNLPKVMDGNIQPIIDALHCAERESRLKASVTG